jgi:hypothetical protein
MATDKPRRCPSWCSGAHDITSVHMAAHRDLGLGLYAYTYQRPGRRKQVAVGGASVTRPHDADALARLIERLADASPEAHRALAEDVRAAARLAFGTKGMEGFQ